MPSGLAVKTATATAVTTAAIAAAETAAAIATTVAATEATAASAAWAFHHQINAGAGGVRLTACIATRSA